MSSSRLAGTRLPSTARTASELALKVYERKFVPSIKFCAPPSPGQAPTAPNYCSAALTIRRAVMLKLLGSQH